MKPYLIDVPVAIFFFARPAQTKKVFEVIKEARPSKLFLVQDGARKGKKEEEIKIAECRDIFKEIDWDCEVYNNYSPVNLGCGKRMYTGMEWIFKYVDRIVRVEDDAVPSVSWIRFCAELLEKYKDDERIATISGVNQLGVYENGGYDYFFSKAGSVAAFATWDRFWCNYDFDILFADNPYYLKLLKENAPYSQLGRKYMNMIKNIQYSKVNNIKRNSWSAPMGFVIFLQNQLIIVPRINMITNIGLAEGATNGGNTKRVIPRRLHSIFNAKRQEIEFPLKHPLFVCNDTIYFEKTRWLLDGGKNPVVRFLFIAEKAVRIFLVRVLKIK